MARRRLSRKRIQPAGFAVLENMESADGGIALFFLGGIASCNFCGGSSIGSSVSLKSSPVSRQSVFGAQGRKKIRRLARINVRLAHKPSRLVCANGNRRPVKAAVFFSKYRRSRKCGRVSPMKIKRKPGNFAIHDAHKVLFLSHGARRNSNAGRARAVISASPTFTLCSQSNSATSLTPRRRKKIRQAQRAKKSRPRMDAAPAPEWNPNPNGRSDCAKLKPHAIRATPPMQFPAAFPVWVRQTAAATPRKEKCGSVSKLNPPLCNSTVACPIHVMLAREVLARNCGD